MFIDEQLPEVQYPTSGLGLDPSVGFALQQLSQGHAYGDACNNLANLASASQLMSALFPNMKLPLPPFDGVVGERLAAVYDLIQGENNSNYDAPVVSQSAKTMANSIWNPAG